MGHCRPNEVAGASIGPAFFIRQMALPNITIVAMVATIAESRTGISFVSGTDLLCAESNEDNCANEGYEGMHPSFLTRNAFGAYSSMLTRALRGSAFAHHCPNQRCCEAAVNCVVGPAAPNTPSAPSSSAGQRQKFASDSLLGRLKAAPEAQPQSTKKSPKVLRDQRSLG